MVWLIVGLIAFHAIHSLRMIAPGWRDARLEAMGENAWKGVYSVVLLIAFVLLVWGYAQARPEAEIAYIPPDWGRHLAWLLMVPAFVFLTFSMRSSRLRFLTHHPLLLSVILWSFAHLLANGDWASVLLFGSFLIWAVIAYWSNVKRAEPLPPIAPIGQDIAAAVGGLVLWLLFFLWAHEWLFGVSPH